MKRRSIEQATWPAWWEYPALLHWLTEEEADDPCAELTLWLLVHHAATIQYGGDPRDPPPLHLTTREHVHGERPPADLVDAARAEFDSRRYSGGLGPLRRPIEPKLWILRSDGS